MLTTEERQRWLARLFAFWLRRMDTYQGDEQLPEMITDTAWSEDLPFIRQLVQNELHKTPVEVKSNIVDFTRQARIKTLEKFLRELQYSTY